MNPTSHPTLCGRDVRPPRLNRLRALYAPDRLYLTYNARSAFYRLLRALPLERGNVVLLPAFHCTALVEPVARAGYRAKFYRITKDLIIDESDVIRKMSAEVALLVVVHFFGFPQDIDSYAQLARDNDCFLIEDCAHSFLTRRDGRYVGHDGDFALFSYYKFSPSHAGGGLGVNRGNLQINPGRRIPLRQSIVIAKALLEQIVENLPHCRVRTALLSWESRRVAKRRAMEDAKGGLPDTAEKYPFRDDLAYAKMPFLSKYVIESGRWEVLVAIRRRNYMLIAGLIEESESLSRLLPDLPEGVSPWAFPVLLRDRRVHEHTLRDRGVPLFTFGETLHRLLLETDDLARADAEYLSDRLMALPIHQQIEEDEIRKYAAILNHYVRTVMQPTKIA